MPRIIPSHDHKIYALIDPRTNEIRYIGFTSRPLEKRLSMHITRSHTKSNLYVCNWIRQLAKENIIPRIETLENVVDNNDWREREIFWIAEGKRLGWKLTNITEGGEGTLGVKRYVSPEQRKKRAERAMGKTHTLEEKRKISQSNIGKHSIIPSAETRLKMSISGKGRIFTEEHKQHMKEGWHKRHPMTEETKKKISDSRKGKKLSLEHRQKIGNGVRGKTLGSHRSEEAKKKMSEKKKGIKLSPEHRLNIIKAMTGKKRGPYKKKREDLK